MRTMLVTKLNMTKLNIVPAKKYHQGFTLLEILFSLVILAVGLLGYAALQLQNTKRAGDAYNQVWAEYQAAQLVQMILGNTDTTNAGGFNTSDTNGAYGRFESYAGIRAKADRHIQCYGDSDSADPFTDTMVNSYDANADDARSCLPEELGSDYLYRMFARNIEATLPNAAFRVRCYDYNGADRKNCTRGGSIITVTIVWSYDNRWNDVAAGGTSPYLRGCPGSDGSGNVIGGKSEESVYRPSRADNENLALQSQSGDECAQFAFFY